MHITVSGYLGNDTHRIVCVRGLEPLKKMGFPDIRLLMFCSGFSS